MLKASASPNNFLGILKQTQEFKKHVVKVGLPKAKNEQHRDSELSVVEVGATNEFGSPENNIPRRSFLREPMIKNQAKIRKLISNEYKKVQNGSNAMASLLKLGEYGEGISRDSFSDNNWAPNAPSTIAKKGSSTPLIDTGQLRQSISNVVEKV